MEKLEEKSAIIAEAAQKDRPSAAGQKGVLFVRFVQFTAGFMIYTYSEHLCVVACILPIIFAIELFFTVELEINCLH